MQHQELESETGLLLSVAGPTDFSEISTAYQDFSDKSDIIRTPRFPDWRATICGWP
jgi:predicted phosphoribosyltransferase